MLMIAVLEELMYSKYTVVQGSPWWLNGGQWWATQETRVPSLVWEDPMCLGGEGNGALLQCSCLENPMDGGAWWAAVHGVMKSRTRLSDFTFTVHFRALRRQWQPGPVFLPGESQGQGEPGGLHSMGS